MKTLSLLLFGTALCGFNLHAQTSTSVWVVPYPSSHQIALNGANSAVSSNGLAAYMPWPSFPTGAPSLGHYIDLPYVNAPTYAYYYSGGAESGFFARSNTASASGLTAMPATAAYFASRQITNLAGLTYRYGPLGSDVTKTWNLGADRKGIEWFTSPNNTVEDRLYQANPSEVNWGLYYNGAQILTFGYSPIYLSIDWGRTTSGSDDRLWGFSNPFPVTKNPNLSTNNSALADALISDINAFGGMMRITMDTVQTATRVDLITNGYVCGAFEFAGALHIVPRPTCVWHYPVAPDHRLVLVGTNGPGSSNGVAAAMYWPDYPAFPGTGNGHIETVKNATTNTRAYYYLTGTEASPFARSNTAVGASLVGMPATSNYMASAVVNLGDLAFRFGQIGSDFTKSWSLQADRLGIEWYGAPTNSLEDRVYQANPTNVTWGLYYHGTEIIRFGYSPIYLTVDWGATTSTSDDRIYGFTDPVTVAKKTGLATGDNAMADALLADINANGGMIRIVWDSIQAATRQDLIQGGNVWGAFEFQGSIQVVPPPRWLFAPRRLGSNFVFDLNTATNLFYSIDYADSLDSTNWIPLPGVRGIDGLLTLTNAAGPNTRFYRVRSQPVP